MARHRQKTVNVRGSSRPQPQSKLSELPIDVVRSILEEAAWTSRQNARELAQLSRAVKAWVDPVLYHTVSPTVRGSNRAGENRVTVFVARLAESIRLRGDPSFFVRNVKNIFIPLRDIRDVKSPLSLVQDVDFILSTCSGAVSISLPLSSAPVTWDPAIAKEPDFNPNVMFLKYTWTDRFSLPRSQTLKHLCLMQWRAGLPTSSPELFAGLPALLSLHIYLSPERTYIIQGGRLTEYALGLSTILNAAPTSLRFHLIVSIDFPSFLPLSVNDLSRLPPNERRILFDPRLVFVVFKGSVNGADDYIKRTAQKMACIYPYGVEIPDLDNDWDTVEGRPGMRFEERVAQWRLHGRATPQPTARPRPTVLELMDNPPSPAKFSSWPGYIFRNCVLLLGQWVCLYVMRYLIPSMPDFGSFGFFTPFYYTYRLAKWLILAVFVIYFQCILVDMALTFNRGRSPGFVFMAIAYQRMTFSRLRNWMQSM
ncbi:hypothetical protein CYLTODRAFT_491676 [Cylindrobasidium torrendii FP15055 ss-10]|uniref:Uncharacterized protein n=1 Tax=Cylindrobasidium torrendii FP15055 ss-10 TaxID=1314674 RepID=A0A0D7B7M1_9AGAR|nr:hypothetical protein CYLTODRAFT_491676 [Cylindrobasidium torrendii FP15055 ss-10]